MVCYYITRPKKELKKNNQEGRNLIAYATYRWSFFDLFHNTITYVTFEQRWETTFRRNWKLYQMIIVK